MPGVTTEQIEQAKEWDLLSYLKDKEPWELIKKHPTDKEYRTKTHDSLVISNGKWNWTTRGIGGRTALDYLIKVRDMPFVEAVRTLCGDTAPVLSQLVRPEPRPPGNHQGPLCCRKRSAVQPPPYRICSAGALIRRSSAGA